MPALIPNLLAALRTGRREASGRLFAWGWQRAPLLAGSAERVIDVVTGRVTRRRGLIETSAGALAIDYLGHDAPFAGWLARAVSATCQGSEPGPPRRPALARATSGEVDLTVIELPSHLRSRFASQGWLILPTLLNHIQPLTGPGAAANSHERRIGHRVRRLALEVRFTRSPLDLEAFYHRMYLPTVRDRHREGAFSRPLSYFRGRLKNGWLIVAEHEGVDIAGLLIEPRPHRPDVLSLLIYGVREGDYGETRDVVRLTPFFRALEWARRSGFRSVQWGGAFRWSPMA